MAQTTHKESQTQSSSEVQEDASDLLPVQSGQSDELIEEVEKALDEIDRLLDENAMMSFAESLDDLEDRPYTLADAIREGSSVTDQAIGAWTTPQGEACALSAAMLAVKARGLDG